MSNKSFGFIVFGAVLAIGVAIAGVNRDWFNNDQITKRDEPQASKIDQPTSNVGKSRPVKPLNEVLGLDKGEMVESGGISRPKRDVDFKSTAAKQKDLKSPLPYAGRPATVNPNENESTAALVKDIQDPEIFGAATSTYVAAQPFDWEAYQIDPESYLGLIRPSRAYQTANPSVDITPLQFESERMLTTLKGEVAILKARGKPFAPITFHCNQYGTFPNKLKTISVPFDKNGIATVEFKTGPGSRELLSVIAASPVHSKQLKYVIRVLSGS